MTTEPKPIVTSRTVFWRRIRDNRIAFWRKSDRRDALFVQLAAVTEQQVRYAITDMTGLRRFDLQEVTDES